MGLGNSRITTASAPTCHGNQTLRRLPLNARMVASATCGAVLENGAGAMPSVIRPITKPGRMTSNRTPDPFSASARPLQNPSNPAFADPYT
jgi:hypothetical protein